MEVITELFKLNFSYLLTGIFIILSAIIAFYTVIGKFSEIIGKPLKWIKKKNEDHLLVVNTANELKMLQEKHEESVKQSIRHDKMIKDTVLDLTKKVDLLANDLCEMRQIQDDDKLAEYKDKIGRSYRFYNERKFSDEHPIPFWNEMEKESLEDLIKQYESHGGENSFVHSIVEPEMEKWKVVEK